MNIKGRTSENIKISQMVSTVILVSTVFSILTFGLIFYMYYNADAKNSAALSSAFEAMGGLFGGITTLAAAYIASKLFNDWKLQHNKSIESIYYQEALNSFKQVSLKVRELKVLHSDCVTQIEAEGYVNVLDFLGKYRKIRAEIINYLDSFQSTLIFLQTMSEKDEERENLEIIYTSANSNMRCDSLKSLMIINKLSKFL
ncbi:hypothetical protein [Acinetobacter higginsii]|uniref:hypothetical protein n=1 Tax=Acinetobacter higginsii TaxID=70347 RepID=UPI001F60AC0F|nr:hypothetical protein [Acinetobacter higginsii]MCI3879786.1 hypothetical protein [Acinetobacter higginsii]